MKKLLLAVVLVLFAPFSAFAVNFTLPKCIPKTEWTPLGTGQLIKIDYPGVVMHAIICPEVLADQTYIHVDTTGNLDVALKSQNPQVALMTLFNKSHVQPQSEAQRIKWLNAYTFGRVYVKELMEYQYTWEVAPLSNSVDRPSRKVVDGKLITYPNPIRVNVGINCDNRIAPTFVSAGADLWMAVVNQPSDLRWVCRKK